MIMPDDTLKKLLAVKENDNVTYFNLQKFMNVISYNSNE